MDKPIVFFDLETTGVSITSDHIVELYAAKWQNGTVIGELHMFFNPGIPMPIDAYNVHHIGDEFLADKPFFADKANEIAEFFGDNYVCGHNVKKFDVPMLSEHLHHCGIAWPTDTANILDTYAVERVLTSHSLIETYKRYFGADYQDIIGEAHGAKADTLATMGVFDSQCKVLNIKDAADFYEAGKPDKRQADLTGSLVYDDSGDICWNFGKHIGRKVKDTPDYANWVLSSSFSSITKMMVQKALTT